VNAINKKVFETVVRHKWKMALYVVLATLTSAGFYFTFGPGGILVAGLLNVGTLMFLFRGPEFGEEG